MLLDRSRPRRVAARAPNPQEESRQDGHDAEAAHRAGGHRLQWTRDGWRCRYCGTTARATSGLSRVLNEPCRGHTASRIPRQEAHGAARHILWTAEADDSQRQSGADVTWCSICGAYSSTKLYKLRGECNGPADGAALTRLRSLQALRHPVYGYRLKKPHRACDDFMEAVARRGYERRRMHDAEMQLGATESTAAHSGDADDGPRQEPTGQSVDSPSMRADPLGHAAVQDREVLYTAMELHGDLNCESMVGHTSVTDEEDVFGHGGGLDEDTGEGTRGMRSTEYRHDPPLRPVLGGHGAEGEVHGMRAVPRGHAAASSCISDNANGTGEGGDAGTSFNYSEPLTGVPRAESDAQDESSDSQQRATTAGVLSGCTAADTEQEDGAALAAEGDEAATEAGRAGRRLADAADARRKRCADDRTEQYDENNRREKSTAASRSEAAARRIRAVRDRVAARSAAAAQCARGGSGSESSLYTGSAHPEGGGRLADGNREGSGRSGRKRGRENEDSGCTSTSPPEDRDRRVRRASDGEALRQADDECDNVHATGRLHEGKVSGAAPARKRIVGKRAVHDCHSHATSGACTSSGGGCGSRDAGSDAVRAVEVEGESTAAWKRRRLRSKTKA